MEITTKKEISNVYFSFNVFTENNYSSRINVKELDPTLDRFSLLKEIINNKDDSYNLLESVTRKLLAVDLKSSLLTNDVMLRIRRFWKTESISLKQKKTEISMTVFYVDNSSDRITVFSNSKYTEEFDNWLIENVKDENWKKDIEYYLDRMTNTD